MSINEKEKAYRKKWEKENRDKRRSYIKKYEESHPEQYKRQRRSEQLRNKYGINAKDYDEMLTNQNGCCAICGRHESEFKIRLSIDHVHVDDYKHLPPNNKRKYVRGLLCRDCNLLLGKLDKVENINKIISYLIAYATKS